MADCQIGALGELADKLDEGFSIIQDKMQLVQNKINSIPGIIDAELAAVYAEIQLQLQTQFPQLTSLADLKKALPEEIKDIVSLATDAVAFATEVERLKEKYEDAGTDLLKDPQNITNLLRDIQGDLNKLCDLVPTYKEVTDPETGEKKMELRGRGNSEIEVRSRPNIEAKSLLSKEGRKLAVKQIKDSLGSIRAVLPEGGTGNISKEGENRYGW